MSIIASIQSEIHQYVLVSGEFNHRQSSDECAALDGFPRGELVKPISLAESNFVRSFADTHNIGTYFINYERNENSDGDTPSSYGLPSNFGQVRGEPPWSVDQPIEKEGDLCVKDNLPIINNGFDGWKVTQCTSTHRLICQRERLRSVSREFDDFILHVSPETNLNYEEAIEECKSLNPPGLPASFKSVGEFQSLISLMEEVDVLNEESVFVWTGMIKDPQKLSLSDASNFIFLDGTINTFTTSGVFPWESIAPNNGEGREHCVRIQRSDNVNTISDLNCDERGGVICKQNLSPIVLSGVYNGTREITVLAENFYKTFEEASQGCKDLGRNAFPVSFEEEEEYNFMVDLIESAKNSSERASNIYWTGLRREGEAGEGNGINEFFFVDGRENSFANNFGRYPWSSSRPNNAGDGEQECVSIDMGHRDTVSEGHIDDTFCAGIDVAEGVMSLGGVVCTQLLITQ